MESKHEYRVYTTREAAKILGAGFSTVTRWCRVLGIPHHGNGYLIDHEALEQLRANIRAHPGRPANETPE